MTATSEIKRDAFGNPFKGVGAIRRLSSWGPDRRCTSTLDDGRPCPTLLNRYNPGPDCLIHTQAKADAEREREALTAEKVH